MEQTSIFDNLYYIYKGFLSNSFFMWALIICLVTFLIMLAIIIKKGKKSKKIIIPIYLVSLIILFVSNRTVLLSSLDSTIDFIIDSIYFPSFIVYVAMMLVVNLNFIYILLERYRHRDILSKNERSVVNAIHAVTFVALQFLFVLVLHIILTNSIDIFSRVSIYSNYLLSALIQISTIIFTLRYMVIFSIWIIRRIKTNRLLDPSKRVVFNDSILAKNIVLKRESILKNIKKVDAIINIDELEKENFVYDYVNERAASNDISKEELKVLKDMVVKYNEDIIKKD